MMKILATLLFIFFAFGISFAQGRTIINDQAAAKMLLQLLVKATEDSPVSKYVYRPLSRPLTEMPLEEKPEVLQQARRAWRSGQRPTPCSLRHDF